MIARRVACLLLVSLACLSSACDDDPVEPDPGPEGPWVPALSAPDSILEAIEIIYNDRTHSAATRADEYAKLLWPRTETAPGFVFRFQPADIQNGLPETWGAEEEVDAHQGMFGAQAAGDIHSLQLAITRNSAQVLSPPDPLRPGWQEIFARNIYLRLMFNPNDGLEVNGGQGEFAFAPAEGGTWRLGDWQDLPRPEPKTESAVEPATWGSFKTLYRGDSPVIPPPGSPESVLDAIAAIYNDTERSAAERAAAYTELFAPGAHDLPEFNFELQPYDVQNGLPPEWGLTTESAVHDALFAAQERGEIFSLQMRMTFGVPSDPDPPVPGQEDWKEIFVTNFNLRLMFNPNDGLEVNGSQAEVLLAPASGGRWYMVEWQDLPRPAPAGKALVETSTWGSIKDVYR